MESVFSIAYILNKIFVFPTFFSILVYLVLQMVLQQKKVVLSQLEP